MANITNFTIKGKNKLTFLKDLPNKKTNDIKAQFMTGLDTLKSKVKLTKKDNKCKHKNITKKQQNKKCCENEFLIKKPPKTVINLISEIEKELELNINNLGTVDLNKNPSIHLQDETYKAYTKFIIDNANVDILPKIGAVEATLNITKETREKYQSWAIEDNLIIKTGRTAKRLNLNNLEVWKNEN